MQSFALAPPPATAERDGARSGGHPEDSRASEPGPVRRRLRRRRPPPAPLRAEL